MKNSEIICKNCAKNGSRLKFAKNKQPCIMNKPKAICWCIERNGYITKKYKECKFFTPVNEK
jgi:hypothetical protein